MSDEILDTCTKWNTLTYRPILVCAYILSKTNYSGQRWYDRFASGHDVLSEVKLLSLLHVCAKQNITEIVTQNKIDGNVL